MLLIATVLAIAGAQAVAASEAERGAELFGLCAPCHSVGKEARNGVGPHLNGLYGRKAASVEGYRYSKAMQRAGADGLIWNAAKLDAYIANPKTLVTGTRMNFKGLADKDERTALLAFLRRYSDNPRDIPEAAPTKRPTDHTVDPEILAIVGDPAYGEYLAGECATCHQRDGSERGIPSITGWPAEDFVLAMHAYRAKVRVHPVMQMIAGRLSNDEIAALAAYFAKLE